MVPWTAGGKENKAEKSILITEAPSPTAGSTDQLSCVALCIPSKVVCREFVINRHRSNKLLSQLDSWLIANSL